ncbi:MAG: PepSY domain-containing protein [Gammaproteobacteria bacterium]|nr:PepSY domain-containing protein [Gammaproteobacteria bacterium]MBU1447752.1 PepSY domain-containing protein [Gammaproteobacteria bacterium]MDD2929462.1 PepSY domain-containing protein [Sideroxydans sp.]MDD5471574.1 PepSY domain-containing protein [Sideroxydans sp.]
MRLLKILPAAAGVIALTATVAFASDGREREEDAFCRTIVAVSHSSVISAGKSSYSAPPLDLVAEAALYHVKVTRGDKIHLVLIDAYSGKVIENREIA